MPSGESSTRLRCRSSLSRRALSVARKDRMSRWMVAMQIGAPVVLLRIVKQLRCTGISAPVLKCLRCPSLSWRPTVDKVGRITSMKYWNSSVVKYSEISFDRASARLSSPSISRPAGLMYKTWPSAEDIAMKSLLCSTSAMNFCCSSSMVWNPSKPGKLPASASVLSDPAGDRRLADLPGEYSLSGGISSAQAESAPAASGVLPRYWWV